VKTTSKTSPKQIIWLFSAWVILWLIAFYFIERYNDENQVPTAISDGHALLPASK
jgi:hypothetical protein